MKKFLLIALALVAAPAVADHMDCNATLVSEGVCRDAANHVLFFDAPQGSFVELRDAIANQTGYADQIECSQALVDAAICTAPQLGQFIANPVSRNDYAEAWIRATLKQLVVRQRRQDAAQTAADGTDPSVDIE